MLRAAGCLQRVACDASLLVGSILFPFAFWRFARAALADDAGVPPAAWAAGAVLLASGVLLAGAGADATSQRIAGETVNKVVAFGFVGLALWDTFRSWDGDLVASRRHLRWALLAYVGGHGLVVLVTEVVLRGTPPPAWLDLLNASVISLALAATLVLLLRPDERAVEQLLGSLPQRVPPGPAANPAPVPTDADGPLLQRLEELMGRGALYRDPALTVSRLAARASMPEYVLRRLVHERLGHRNFASYVNSFRLDEVAAKLQDPAQARRPVLTLALEAGFGSIGPFNRAFKERFAKTPTVYRTEAQESQGEKGRPGRGMS